MSLIKAYIALGSNIEPTVDYLTKARQLLNDSDEIDVVDTSRLYLTEPVGYTDQDAFLNQVVAVETTLSAHALLQAIQAIEQQLGRKREIRWGPRTIDLDILLYHNDHIVSEDLVIPHPRMAERAFVLVPLSDIATEIKIPGTNLTVQQAMAKLSRAELNDVRLYQLNDKQV
ncbi:2-amino-4-hydroxy-6-hydroxymethyldihydropteridine pyrophosphokinase [Halolactibacillus miurensis]|uniref:2-amino-4-hydroxy-6-hydroxymethyldihydropteridine diphosphokinase n=1 Tax=Halolactibacillus miurensis TaxID=306541 RepID=A0A1I6TFX9_9BACI|nr:MULTISPECIES: 2-amino-4-hydroxy-6-hydroxymethyldihydropteridine diphosphokinase [Halolactibacillus]GEM04636.1 2-amino-4-hydroxy-6-hydroxymethyldihydropteridine pyrophosphokinase [Halolactibacillus miurensis]SFS88090.1 2-amino-4-hydroxy-6-hydroxymethyldihydropteridinediphosphokinase [Halolactibacillus miurensis]